MTIESVVAKKEDPTELGPDWPTIFEELGKRYVRVHDQVADGCKVECGCYEFGRLRNGGVWMLGKTTTEFFFRFGGYCIGNCDRWHEAVGDSVEQVASEVNKLLDDPEAG